MIDNLEYRIADKRSAVFEHHAFVFVGENIAQAFSLQVEIAVGRMPVKSRPMGAIVHQESGRRTASAGRPAAEVNLPFEDCDSESRAREVTRDDRPVMAPSHHYRVISLLRRHDVMAVVVR